MSIDPLEALKLQKKLRVTGRLIFETAWRIGTGKEGVTLSDLGVLLDPAGRPVLPGSSLKGKLRSTCETLAHALNLRACLLNVAASQVECVSDMSYYTRTKEQHSAAIHQGPQKQLEWIKEHTCDVCKLFGSPVRAARLRCADGKLTDADAAPVQVRDGVVLDRDSHTAVAGLKYDYEVVPAGTAFDIHFDLENTTPADEGLFGAALFEWTAGGSLGGFTSRGLGRFVLTDAKLFLVDFTDPVQRKRYLTTPDPSKKLTETPDWQGFFTKAIEAQQEKGGAS